MTHDAFSCVAEASEATFEARTTSGASGTTSSRWACGDEREPVVRAIWRARTAMNAKLYDATKFRLRRCELAEDARGKAVVRASASVKAQLDRDMTKVKKIIDATKDTIEKMPKGFVKAAMQAPKTAKKLHRLAGKLEKALASIERTLQLETFRIALEGFSASVKDLTEL